MASEELQSPEWVDDLRRRLVDLEREVIDLTHRMDRMAPVGRRRRAEPEPTVTVFLEEGWW